GHLRTHPGQDRRFQTQGPVGRRHGPAKIAVLRRGIFFSNGRPHSARVQSNRVSASATLRRNSYFVRLRSPLSTVPAGIIAPAFPQRSPPRHLAAAACGGLRPAPDCRTRRALLHLSYSYAPPVLMAALVSHGHERTHALQRATYVR